MNPVNDSQTAGYQSWKMLSFLHWRYPADILQKLIPDGLQIEEYDGTAWLGVVPFSMEAVRPWWSPAVPGISWFLETNVRTYVVDERGIRGVWFFSLDANSRLAVTVARNVWHLPYVYSTMELNAPHINATAPDQPVIHYRGQRTHDAAANYDIRIQPDFSRPPQTAPPDTLEHFLVERYILFAAARGNRLMTGQVHHSPYELRPVIRCEAAQSLTNASDLPISSSTPPDHIAWSDGVDVRVSPLRVIR